MTLAGREVMFRRTHVGQVIMLQRTAMRAVTQAQKDSGDEGERVGAVSAGIMKVLDFIDRMIISEDDRQFVEDKMLEGEITWEQLARALAGGKESTEDDEAPEPRAPRKSPKAAPVDLTGKKPAQIVSKTAKAASRGRAKR